MHFLIAVFKECFLFMEFNKSQLIQVFSIKISVRISAPYGRKVENKFMFEQTPTVNCRLLEALNRRFITTEDFNSKRMIFTALYYVSGMFTIKRIGV